MTTYINSNNDWDPLKKVIVGRIDGACTPHDEPQYRIKSNGESTVLNWGGPRNQSNIEKANLQLENFVDILKGEGVEVFRPDIIDFSKETNTPGFYSKNQNCAYCPRDTLMVLDNEIIETNMSWRSRYFEYYCYRPLLNNFFTKDRTFKWTMMPKATLDDKMLNSEYPYKREDPRRIDYVQKQIFPITTEPVCDAADVIRLGKDLFIQKGYLTNDLAIEWFQRQYSDKYNVHKVELENNIFKTHMDALYCPIRPGFIIFNEEVPIYSQKIKSYFKDNDWNLIPAPKSSNRTMPSGSTSISSLNINMLSLNENTIIVEASEEKTINFLREEGIDVIPVPFRDCYKFGGSFHCCTSDIHRDGKLQSYFK